MATNVIAAEQAIDTHVCPKFEKAASILGKRWTGLLIRVLLDGPRRFNDILKIVEAVSDRVLTERLRELEAEGLVERTVYPESPVRVLYSLTEKGRDFQSVLQAMQSWGERWVTLEEVNSSEAES